tara:strand:- start:1292 stop:1963 length:672 start_codon:yes stop_codon:yes gene_type:complete
MAYTITGTSISSSSSAEADMCRVSGYLKDLHGSAMVSSKITVRNLHIPAAVGADTLVINEHQAVRADGDGYLEFDLYQGATVRIEIPGRESDLIRTVVVPSESSIDLVALVFPYITEIEFDDGSDLDADVGESFTLDITTSMSDGEEAGSSVIGALTIEISDEDVVKQVENLTFRALKAGSATVEITDVDTDEVKEYQESDGDVIERLQHPDITLPTITITVS